MIPMFMPMFTNACTANQMAMPDATSVPNWSSALVAIRSAQNSSRPSRPITMHEPTKPSSLPTTAKMKSVCCSGTKLPATS